jgi:polyisoprenoid-binding protein YceI
MTSMRLALDSSLLAISLATAVRAKPATYTFEPNHTFVRFSYDHQGFSIQEQRFNKVNAVVIYDLDAKSA